MKNFGGNSMSDNNSNCNHDCHSCGQSCGEKSANEFMKTLNEFSSVKKVIAIVSGKGGVGKSLVTGLSAVTAQRKGLKTAILDADITGPSIPKMFGLSKKITGNNMGITPAVTNTGISVLSSNLLVDDPTQPVVWRGPVISGLVTQFWSEAHWDNIDIMFIDLPPGTGDVPLSVFQSIPIDGIIVVTSPQDLVSMIVEKALTMARLMNIPVLGLVENMSYIKCPDCGKHINIFGDGKAIQSSAKKYGIDILAKIEMNPQIATLCDNGIIENVNEKWLSETFLKMSELF